MRNLMLSLAAAGLALPASLALPGAVGQAAAKTARHHHTYHSTARSHRCRYSKGNTGLIAGGVAGGVIGHEVLGHGLLGIGAGVVGGAVAGRAIDRSMTAKKRGC